MRRATAPWLTTGERKCRTSPLGPIGQIARSVSDAAASEKWYRDVLGLPHLYTFGTLAFFDCGGTRLMLSQDKAAPRRESILYLRVRTSLRRTMH